MSNQGQQKSHKHGGRRIALSGFALVAVGGLLIAVSGIAQAATSVGLGTADSFAVLAATAITNTGTTTITGDVGGPAAASITGFGTVTLNGTNHANDGVAGTAQSDLVTAYNNAAGQTSTATISADLGGMSLVSGVYTSASTLGLTGTLTLNAQGNPDAVFIFQAGSTLTTASGSSVALINGAQACNVFWQVGSSATLGTNSTFRGSVLALTSISVTTGATVDGRVLARNGAVTLDANTITRSTCAASSVATPPAYAASSVATPPAYAANVGPGAQGAVCPWGGQYNDAGLCVGTGTSTLMNPSATPVPSPTVTPVVSATPAPTLTATPQPTPSVSQVPTRPLGGVNTGDNSIG